MSLNETVIEGTLKPDGTLELDEKPNLSPGRVQVIVQPLSKSAPTKRGLVEVMDDIRASQRARGYPGRTPEAMQAEEKDRLEEDAEYDQRSEQLWGGPLPPAAKKEKAAMMTYLDTCIFIYWIEGPAPSTPVFERISPLFRRRGIVSPSVNSLGWNAW